MASTNAGTSAAHDPTHEDFVARLQHDLRVPLNVLLLTCETMDRNPAQITPQHIATISRNVQRLIDLVDGLSHAPE